MRSGDMNPDQSLRVIHLYARLAAGRAVDAKGVLHASKDATELLAQSAKALEDAAGTLTMVSELYAGDRQAFAGALRQQVTALLLLAAQFEEAADLSRHQDG
jgi:hypothetical protein